MHDVILVLGYCNDKDHPVFKARMDKAIALYNEGLAPQLILSGCCSDKLDIKPRTTEAMAMRDYALDHGVPLSVMMLEEEAVDTLGNFYYSKINILEPCSWYNLGFVSTPWHTHRSRWLAEMVLGPEFDVTDYTSAAPSGWGEKENKASEAYNSAMLQKTQQQLADITPGDHASISPFLGKPPRG